MRKWHLPVNIQEAVHYHHTPLLARSAPLDAALTNLSNQIALFMQNGEEGNQPGQVIDDEAWQFCSLSADLAESVIEEADALCEESFRLFIQS
ncbi:MAG: hypothetical protein GXP10_09435 [Gammaproteobacteria bacterium]|nr:hypothetical protein [Gammaproteobacteria bacterium]